MPAAAVKFALVLYLCCSLATNSESSVAIDRRFGATLKSIQDRSPYKYVRDVILAAEGETKAITCAFDNLFTAGKHWKRTFYSPVTWFAYSPGSKPKSESPVTDGMAVQLAGGKHFAYKLINPMSVVPSGILVLENVPQQLSDTYFICRTNLQTGSLQVFYLKVIKPTLYRPGSRGGTVQARVGSSVQLNCETGGNFPMTSVYWSRRLPDSAKWSPRRRPVLAWGAKYSLPSVTMDTAQYLYTCHVNNHLDPEWTADFRIDLINATKAKPGPITGTYNGVLPAFTSRSSQAAPKLDESYTLSCRVQGDGVRFTWLRNGTELKPYADPNLYTYSSTQGKLHFTDLILRRYRARDRGLYECLARNEAGDTRFAFYLENVLASPEPEPGEERQQQRMGSGWSDTGSGEDPGTDSSDALPTAEAAAAAAASSGDRRPPTSSPNSQMLRRARRRQGQTRSRRLPLP